MGEKRFMTDTSPWTPITDTLILKVLGKFAEELFECSEVAADMDSSDEQFANEIADVLCNRRLVAEMLAADLGRVEVSAEPKGSIDEYDLIVALGKCGAAVARCIIQGLDGVEPSIGRVNRSWLIDEMTTLGEVAGRAIAHFELDAHAIKQRMAFKREHLLRWHQMECAE